MAIPTELVSKSTKNAPIWQHFGFEADDKGEPKNADEATCKHCRRKIKAKGGNTSNLHAHLRKHHASEAAKMGPAAKGGEPGPSTTAMQTSIGAAFSKGTKYKRDSVRWKACTLAVTTHLAKDMVSFRTVEKESFKSMLQTLDRQYEPPDRKYFSQTAIPEP